MTTTPTVSLLDAALAYAAAGRPVLPLHYRRDDGVCSCGDGGCPSPAKHPIGALVPHGAQDATTDAAAIRRWWGREPHANIGGVVGPNEIVLDIDGPAAPLGEAHGRPIPDSVRARSGRDAGGWHVWLTIDVPAPSRTGILAGVDVRGAGAYVVLPPSQHQSGRPYGWVRSPDAAAITPAPPWLTSLINDRHSPGANGHAAPIPECITEGQRNAALASLAGSLRRRGASVEAIRAALLAENEVRCDPPLSETEIEAIAASIARYPPTAVSKEIKNAEEDHSPGLISFRDHDPLRRAGRVVTVAAVQTTPVTWLWPGRIPRGKKVMLDGDPGTGKSTATLDLVARLTIGREMPDGARPDLDGPVDCLLLSAEDGISDTIRPRLEAAGADLNRVHVLTAVVEENGERLPSLADVDLIREQITRFRVGLVVVDPLMAFLDATTNSHRDQDVRRLLAPLTAVCEQTGATLVLVRHLNKAAGGTPLYRGGGSIGLIGDARAGLLAARDPDDAERRILAMTKSNLAREAPALAYRLVSAENGAVRVEWDGPTEHTAAQLLTAPVDDAGRSARDEACAFLREVLADGPRPVRDLLRDARDAGIAEATLRRARGDLRIITRKAGMSGGWIWELPPKVIKNAEVDQPQRVITFGGDDHLRGVADVVREEV